jgi:hypothetical protein
MGGPSTLKGSAKRGLLYPSVGLSIGTLELNGVVSYLFCYHEDPMVSVTAIGVPKMHPIQRAKPMTPSTSRKLAPYKALSSFEWGAPSPRKKCVRNA